MISKIVMVVGLLACVGQAYLHPSHVAQTKRNRHNHATTENPFVTVEVNDTRSTNGWIGLRINQTKSFVGMQDDVWYSAGLAEGKVLQKEIFDHFTNTLKQTPNTTVADPKLVAWIEKHIAYQTGKIAELNATSKFWHSNMLLFCQLQGISDGYTSAAPSGQALTFMDIFMLNFNYEMGDVQTALGLQSYDAKHRGGCTAYIKPLPDGSDLTMTHTTWGTFTSMLRVLKTYNFGNVGITFSGYPGLVHSGDDWYMLSNGLTVQETTNLIFNNNLYQFIIPETVSEFLRVMISHQMATDGQSWVENFCRYNSGTYSNQWMVVDMNKFVPGTMKEDLPDGLLWIAEQLPGMCPKKDVTNVLRTRGFWESYNIPYFNATYIASGNGKMYEKFGDLFSYYGYARPQIIARTDPSVTKIADIQKLIRFNEWQTDNASTCPGCHPITTSPMLSIASRGDLVDPNNNWGIWAPWVGPGTEKTPYMHWRTGAFGAIDAKIASYQMLKNGTGFGLVVTGPTHEQQLPFQWSTSPANKLPLSESSHLGQPDLFDFDWVQTNIWF